MTDDRRSFADSLEISKGGDRSCLPLNDTRGCRLFFARADDHSRAYRHKTRTFSPARLPFRLVLVESRRAAVSGAARRCSETSRHTRSLRSSTLRHFFLFLILYPRGRCDPEYREVQKECGTTREQAYGSPERAGRGDSQRWLLPYLKAPPFPVPKSSEIARASSFTLGDRLVLPSRAR